MFLIFATQRRLLKSGNAAWEMVIGFPSPSFVKIITQNCQQLKDFLWK